jgi:hypothetical protein
VKRNDTELPDTESQSVTPGIETLRVNQFDDVRLERENAPVKREIEPLSAKHNEEETPGTENQSLTPGIEAL